LIEMIDNRRPV